MSDHATATTNVPDASAPDIPWTDESIPATDANTIHSFLRSQAKALQRLIDNLDNRTVETLLDGFIALDHLKKAAKKISDAAKDEIGDKDEGVMALLLEQFVDEGVRSKKHAETGRLAHITNRIGASCADGVAKPDAAKAMEQIEELSAFVELGFNFNSVSAHFREQVKELEEKGVPITDDALTELIPEELRGVIRLSKTPYIGVRG